MTELQRTQMPDGEIRMMRQDYKAPTLGRTVLFTPHGGGANGAKEYVAIVGQVWHDPDNTRPYVNLLVFPPFQAPEWMGSVQEGDGPYSWRWPAREPDTPSA